jgi:hypothetical protein
VSILVDGMNNFEKKPVSNIRSIDHQDVQIPAENTGTTEELK